MKPSTIAVDLAKSLLEVAMSDRPVCVRERHRLSRARFVSFFAERQPAMVLLEACGSAHYWARCLQSLGHTVVLLPPQDARPYVGRNKTDRCDATALLEAYRKDEIRRVPVKSVEQQTITALHDLRSACLATRTVRINTLRGILREFGILIPVGARYVVPHLRALLGEGTSQVPGPLQHTLGQAADEIVALEERIRSVEHQLRALAQEILSVRRLQSVLGIGLLTATALGAVVGDAQHFPSGRHLASFLGLTPRERSSGAIRRIGRISKRGGPYLRMLLIHGARAVLGRAKLTHTPIAFESGSGGSNRGEATTRLPVPWPASSPASPGPSGPEKRTPITPTSPDR